MLSIPTYRVPEGIIIKLYEVKLEVNINDNSPIVGSKKGSHSTDIVMFYLGSVYPSLENLEKWFNDLKFLKDNNWQPIKTRKSNKIATSEEILGLDNEKIANKHILRSSRLDTPKESQTMPKKSKSTQNLLVLLCLFLNFKFI